MRLFLPTGSTVTLYCERCGESHPFTTTQEVEAHDDNISDHASELAHEAGCRDAMCPTCAEPAREEEGRREWSASLARLTAIKAPEMINTQPLLT